VKVDQNQLDLIGDGTQTYPHHPDAIFFTEANSRDTLVWVVDSEGIPHRLMKVAEKSDGE
jgi:hypothetical protein